DRIDKPELNTYQRIVEGEHPVAKKAAGFVSPFPRAHLVRVAEEASTLWSQAKAAMEKGDFAQARALLLRAVKAYPRDASLWFHLGASCGELNDLDAAISAFEQSRKLDS